MAEDKVDRPVTVADLQSLQAWIGAELARARLETQAGFEAARLETKARFDAASDDAKMHVEVLRREVKADLDAAMEETKAEIAKLKTEIAELRRELADGLERVETKILTSFHGWARTYESKARGLSSLVATFEERLSLAEDRLNRLERGESNIPPVH